MSDEPSDADIRVFWLSWKFRHFIKWMRRPPLTPARPPLTEKRRWVLEIIADIEDTSGALRPSRAIKGAVILDELQERYGCTMDQQTLTTHMLPVLIEHYGVRNTRGAGYWIDYAGRGSARSQRGTKK